MTGSYLDRLVARGGGGIAGPQVRGLPRLYAPAAQGEELIAYDTELPTEGDQSPALQPVAAIHDASAPASQAAKRSSVARAHGSGAPPIATAIATAQAAQRTDVQPPAPLPTRGAATAAAPSPSLAPPDGLEPPAQAGRAPPASRRPAAPTPAAPLPLASRDAPDAAPTPGPSVSIGRIDIVVAPPAPPAAPTPDPRTRGFSGYGRLRRGLSR